MARGNVTKTNILACALRHGGATFAQPIELLERALGKQAVIDWQPMQSGDVPVTFVDISKLARQLGYASEVRIEKGIPQFVEWFRSRATVC